MMDIHRASFNRAPFNRTTVYTTTKESGEILALALEESVSAAVEALAAETLPILLGETTWRTFYESEDLKLALGVVKSIERSREYHTPSMIRRFWEMDTDELKIHTAGELIVLDVALLLTGSEVAMISVLKPDGTTTIWIATPVAGTNTVTYLLLADDLDLVGNWYLVPVVDGEKGETARIKVIEEFD